MRYMHIIYVTEWHEAVCGDCASALSCGRDSRPRVTSSFRAESAQRGVSLAFAHERERFLALLGIMALRRVHQDGADDPAERGRRREKSRQAESALIF